MKIGIVRERRPHERRVAASAETTRKFIALGLEVLVESGAGTGAAIRDEDYALAGAKLFDSQSNVLSAADIILKVQKPIGPGAEVPGENDEVAMMKPGAVLVSLMEPYRDRALFEAIAERGIVCFAMELVPRISRAQSMDVLSSQSNLAGYRSVLEAGAAFGRSFPMMMTAAGTIAPAKCLVMGAGVAGLQAIATARRLGAVVSATDVRPAVKQQVESLGATFVAVENDEFREAETAGGYAKEMSSAYREEQAALIASTIPKQNIVICTALIPGRPAPVLISDSMVRAMRPGSVIVDLAVEQGGNCPLSEPGEIVVRHGVTIIGHINMPSRIAVDASALYARNLLSFITPLLDSETGRMGIDRKDEIVRGCLVTMDGEVVHPAVQQVALDSSRRAARAKSPTSAAASTQDGDAP